MKTLRLVFFLAFAVAFAGTASVMFTGCPATTGVTLAPGGAYSDPVLFQIDQATGIADSTLTAFVAWQKANAAYLAKWPEVGSLSVTIQAKQDSWLRDVIAARDDYVVAASAYKGTVNAATAAGVTSARAKIDGALAVITTVIAQAAAYQSAHVQ